MYYFFFLIVVLAELYIILNVLEGVGCLVLKEPCITPSPKRFILLFISISIMLCSNLVSYEIPYKREFCNFTNKEANM